VAAIVDRVEAVAARLSAALSLAARASSVHFLRQAFDQVTTHVRDQMAAGVPA
jgi:hypothetical protein